MPNFTQVITGDSKLKDNNLTSNQSNFTLGQGNAEHLSK